MWETCCCCVQVCTGTQIVRNLNKSKPLAIKVINMKCFADKISKMATQYIDLDDLASSSEEDTPPDYDTYPRTEELQCM